MKRTAIVLIFLILLISCSRNPYLLKDEGKDKNFLIEKIDKLNNENFITKKPLIVIDGEPFSYSKLRRNKLELYKKDIDTIHGFFKKNDQGAIYIYGENAKNGVILIKTKLF